MEIITRKEAKEKGLTRYYTGKPCLNGHISERLLSSGQCLTCNKDRYEQNKEEIKQRVRNWSRDNKDRKRATDKAYRENNKQKVRKGWKDWADRNRASMNEARKAWRESNKERLALYWKNYHAEKPHIRRMSSLKYYYNNKDKVSAQNRLHQKQVKVATPAWYNSFSVRVKYKERDTMSKVTGIVHHVDHIIPLQGENVCGLHVHNNLRVIPARDNLRKSNKLELR